MSKLCNQSFFCNKPLYRFIEQRNRGIPNQMALENCPIRPYTNEVPQSNNLIDDYISQGGDINAEMGDLYPFESTDLNIQFMTTLNLIIKLF